MTAELDLLRRAEALMRERAQAATPGPWSAADEHGLLGPDASPAWCVSNMRPGYESMSPTDGYLGDVAETSLGFPERRDEHNAEHIASWHPAVALAVADTLAQHILEHETHDCLYEPCAHVALARTYLNERD